MDLRKSLSSISSIVQSPKACGTVYTISRPTSIPVISHITGEELPIESIYCWGNTSFFLSKEDHHLFACGASFKALKGSGGRTGVRVEYAGVSGLERMAGGENSLVLWSNSQKKLKIFLPEGSGLGEGFATLGEALNEGMELTEVSLGRGHVLAMVGMEESKLLFVWGRNETGQLGIGGKASEGQNQPYLITGLSGVAGVKASGDSSFVVTEGGEMLSWGSNGFNRLGFSDPALKIQRTPRAFSTKIQISSLATAKSFVLALDLQGDVFAWGLKVDQNFGKLFAFGQGDLPIFKFESARKFAKLACSKRSALLAAFPPDPTQRNAEKNCAFLVFGGNEHRAFLDSQMKFIRQPTLVSFNLRGGRVEELSGGEDHFLIRTKEGHCYAWGDNQFSQCGVSLEPEAPPRSDLVEELLEFVDRKGLFVPNNRQSRKKELLDRLDRNELAEEKLSSLLKMLLLRL